MSLATLISLFRENCAAASRVAGFGIGAICLQVNIAKDCGYTPGSEGRRRGQQALAEVAKSPHQDSEHHHENAEAADGDHEGNLPT